MKRRKDGIQCSLWVLLSVYYFLEKKEVLRPFCQHLYFCTHTKNENDWTNSLLITEKVARKRSESERKWMYSVQYGIEKVLTRLIILIVYYLTFI